MKLSKDEFSTWSTYRPLGQNTQTSDVSPTTTSTSTSSSRKESEQLANMLRPYLIKINELNGEVDKINIKVNGLQVKFEVKIESSMEKLRIQSVEVISIFTAVMAVVGVGVSSFTNKVFFFPSMLVLGGMLLGFLALIHLFIRHTNKEKMKNILYLLLVFGILMTVLGVIVYFVIDPGQNLSKLITLIHSFTLNSATIENTKILPSITTSPTLQP